MPTKKNVKKNASKKNQSRKNKINLILDGAVLRSSDEEEMDIIHRRGYIRGFSPRSPR